MTIFLILLGVLVVVGGAFAAFAWTAGGTQPSGERLARVQQSPQYTNGKFANPLPEQMDIWGSMKQMFGGGDYKVPKQPVPIAAPTDLSVPPATGLRITWMGHSSMLIEIDGLRFLTDPVWGERASPLRFMGPKRFYDPIRPLEALLPLDAVVLSHDHYDHLDEPSIRELNRLGARFITPLGLGAHLEYWGVPAERITELDWWQSIEVGDLELVCTPSRHFSGRFVTDRNKTLWSSWSFIGKAHRVYFSGDSAMFPGFAEIGETYGPFDVTLMENGAYNKHWADVHMGPEQALAAHQALKGTHMIPVHWGTFNLAAHNWTEPVERLLVAAEAVGVSVYVPQPGESFEPDRMPTQNRWWPDRPWQTAAEHPVVSSGL